MTDENIEGVGFLKSTPNTSERAIIYDWRKVTNARVVELKDAFFRGSFFSGTFEVADKEDPFFEGHNGLRIETKIIWFGRSLKTRWPRVLLGSQRPKIKTDYTGQVAFKLGKPKPAK